MGCAVLILLACIVAVVMHISTNFILCLLAVAITLIAFSLWSYAQ